MNEAMDGRYPADREATILHWKQIYKRIHISSCSVVAGNIIQYSVSNDNKNMRYSSYE